ncbi:hypothetical protein AB6A40_005763 [Gnathostoma spinigerum]|uniref:Uncharacterized protein n=1 Tax=Gnathostoma spinigerum TaxID=75299 RepID=A0ABD6EP21_9BILA
MGTVDRHSFNYIPTSPYFHTSRDITTCNPIFLPSLLPPSNSHLPHSDGSRSAIFIPVVFDGAKYIRSDDIMDQFEMTTIEENGEDDEHYL